MEKKLDFLVDMHIQHTEHLQVDSAGAARMTLEACHPMGNGEIRRVFLNYAEAFPHMSYQVPVGNLHPYDGRGRGGGDRPTDGRQAPHQLNLLSAIPTYNERPTVLPISSLQDLPRGPGRTSGGRGVDSPLSMLSVNHEELERSPSGFSISGERDEEDGEDSSVGVRFTPRDADWTRPRPSYLAEGETDTDTDPFTPSGGPLPLSSTGEGFGDVVWATPPWEVWLHRNPQSLVKTPNPTNTSRSLVWVKSRPAGRNSRPTWSDEVIGLQRPRRTSSRTPVHT